jgi:hypothetical protein
MLYNLKRGKASGSETTQGLSTVIELAGNVTASMRAVKLVA